MAGGGALLAVNLLFFAANMTKLVHGAWLSPAHRYCRIHRPHHLAARPGTGHPAASARRGAAAGVRRPASRHEAPAAASGQYRRLPQPRQDAAPLALHANVEQTGSSASTSLSSRSRPKPVPHVPAAERLAIDDLGCKDGRIIHVTEFFSYIDHANVPGLLPLIRKAGIESRLDRDKVSYLLSRIELRPGNTPGMGRWRKRLFPATRRITADAAEYFRLSRERTVIMGSRIEL